MEFNDHHDHDSRFTVHEFTELLQAVKDVMDIQATLARIEKKIDDHLAGHFTPEQQAIMDDMKEKLDANDAAVAAALKK